jgi:hypothetical protein
MLRYFRYGCFVKVWSRISNVLIRYTGPKFAAWLTSLTFDVDGKSGAQILCLCRESFSKDIAQLRKRTRFSYTSINGGFTRFQMAWTPLEMQIQTFYQSYKGPGQQSAFEKSCQYASHLINLSGKEKKVSAVLSANFDYWQDAGFKKACQELNIPFIVLSREHLVIPSACDEVKEWYIKSSYVFNGSIIAVAGESTKKIIDSIKTVCNKDKVIVTGLPRFDEWLDIKEKTPIHLRKSITLLTFSEGYYADTTFKEVLRIFCSIAKDFNDHEIKFIVKTKDAADNHYVNKLLPKEDITNLIVGNEFNLPDTLSESRLVINYNSLSLVEAAIAESEIVIPAWGECRDSGGNTMYPKNNPKIARAVRFAHSENELRAIINENILSPGIAPNKSVYQDFINEIFYVPPVGTISQGLESLFDKCINIR